ncbi:peptidase, M23/M37 family protein [Fulvimarina pelagi HTCC2506]|uniref:Peptidase, M23/M37 family protein n=2 Tax=Fulvimarina pelagi TaxID=217511 RepID=Q0G0I5_9HYPH|nr:M23 family metallopeptidase [Fulvimarina pelagi]EAU40608.1 peptidase, M23/M37 family protein [Fulvimarina pelagi HTCC2506]BAT31158.1 peptidase, M23/M37 family protein [Fulvimarina pelagi]
MAQSKPAFGDDPPLIVDRRRKPDRRQVSLRWLTGTLLTGVTSSALMGIALSAALEGGAGVSRPSQLATQLAEIADVAEKGARVIATALPLASSHQIVELSTIVREGDREVVSTQPFALVNMLLAARHPTTQEYPDFNPLAIMSETEPDSGTDDADRLSLASAQIYGERVETDIMLKVSDFPFDEASYENTPPLTSETAEQLVRQAMPGLSYEPVQVASLSRVDPFRFGFGSEADEYEPGSAFRVIQENVSFEPSETANERPRFYEEILPLREAQSISDALAGLKERGIESEEAGAALAVLLEEIELQSGDALRLGIESSGETREVIRLSAYRGKKHLGTTAKTQDDIFEEGLAPEMADSVAAIFDERESEAPMRSDMPTIYDGIFQAGLAYGFDAIMCQELIRTIASDVDLQSRLAPTDQLSVFYTMDDAREGQGASRSDILFVQIKLGDMEKRLYRFKPDGAEHAAYFDSEGRSARQFLIRKPLPRGRFTSSFSTGRKHPVLGYVRPHWGVDWAAPRGTPILAAAGGTVLEAGWKSGYGRHIKIKHANGYVTSYSHQSGFAKGISAGSRVSQGEVVGYVGSTGLSTGNHLHYEIEVNGKKVDPMRIKVGSETVLKGDDLSTFNLERERIDALIEERFEAPQIASR